jgi:hypothetical protein
VIWIAATGWLPAGNYTYVDEPPQADVNLDYRVRTRDALGQVSISSSPEATR